MENWSRQDMHKYLTELFSLDTELKFKEKEISLIESYYPGSKHLTNEEKSKRKYYDSLHTFQYCISIKRFIEETGEGEIISESNGWRFVKGSAL